MDKKTDRLEVINEMLYALRHEPGNYYEAGLEALVLLGHIYADMVNCLPCLEHVIAQMGDGPPGSNEHRLQHVYSIFSEQKDKIRKVADLSFDARRGENELLEGIDLIAAKLFWLSVEEQREEAQLAT